VVLKNSIFSSIFFKKAEQFVLSNSENYIDAFNHTYWLSGGCNSQQNFNPA